MFVLSKAHPGVAMTRFNRIFLGFATLLLLGLLCSARPVVEKHELGAQEIFDQRSDGQDMTLSTIVDQSLMYVSPRNIQLNPLIVFTRSHIIIADHRRAWSTGSNRACPCHQLRNRNT